LTPYTNVTEFTMSDLMMAL